MQRKYKLMPRTYNSPPLSIQEKEKVKVLSASGKTPHSIAKELSRSPHTIKRYLSCPEASRQIQEIKEELGDFFEDLAKRMITSITDQDIKKINAYQRTVSAGISVDKLRLLKDESTENIDIRAAIGNLEEMKAQLLERIRQLKEEKNSQKQEEIKYLEGNHE